MYDVSLIFWMEGDCMKNKVNYANIIYILLNNSLRMQDLQEYRFSGTSDFEIFPEEHAPNPHTTRR